MKRLLALAFLVALVATACADPESAVSVDPGDVLGEATTTLPPATTSTSLVPTANNLYPVEVTDGLGAVTIESRPEAIVSLSPTATEIIFAIGAGDQVLAVDSLSNYPEDAPMDPDLSAWSPSVEAIIGMEPDLVVITSDPGDLVAGLNAAGIPVVTQFAVTDLDGVYAQIEQLGVVTDHVSEAAILVSRMQSDVDELIGSVPVYPIPPTYYHELDDTLYSVTSQTFIGQIYSLLGLENVADPADDGSAYGYPQLSAEYLVEADPDFIFLADTKCCSVTAASVAERDGWGDLSAVLNGRVIELDDDIASRWGPRVVEYLRVVADAMAGAEVD